jgi:histidinol-phosphate/aromatic aminotransferase/cobyric acid decarboxylase-like protein
MYESKLQPLIATITSERDRLYRELQRIPGLAPVPSRANFMVVRSQIGPGLIFEGLLERGILIRDVSSYPLLSDYFRISVGTTEENDLLLQALKEICG